MSQQPHAAKRHAGPIDVVFYKGDLGTREGVDSMSVVEERNPPAAAEHAPNGAVTFQFAHYGMNGHKTNRSETFFVQHFIDHA
ncbi:MAG: hypothetical protein ABIR37_01685 [Candidatus Saccharimonadales bacterium]